MKTKKKYEKTMKNHEVPENQQKTTKKNIFSRRLQTFSHSLISSLSLAHTEVLQNFLRVP